MRLVATWVTLFVLAFAIVLACGWYARGGLDLGMIIVLLIPLGIVLMTGCLLFSGVVVWLIPRLRCYFVPANLCVLLVLLMAFAFYLFGRASFPADLEKVKAYVVVAEPALETYYQHRGHYPDTLDQLNLSVSAPHGMSYHKMLDRTGEFKTYQSSPHHKDDEIYLIDFWNAHYCGHGYWFVDE